MSKKFILGLMITTLSLAANAEDLGRSIPVSARLKSALSSCKVEQFSDFMACPRAEKLAFQSESDLQKYLSEEGPYRPTPSNARRSYLLLKDSISHQSDISELLAELEVEDTDKAVEESNSLTSVLPSLKTYLNESSSRGIEFYTDADTDWAASVSARAVLLVNRAQKTITIILHGDIE